MLPKIHDVEVHQLRTQGRLLRLEHLLKEEFGRPPPRPRHLVTEGDKLVLRPPLGHLRTQGPLISIHIRHGRNVNPIGSCRLGNRGSIRDDNNCGDVGGPVKCYIYDPTQADARKFYWQGLHNGYYKYGIKIFWLDASEPEISTSDASKAALDFNNSLGKGSEVVMMYPDFHMQTIHDGLLSEGETDVVMLTRSAWAGMQRWGAALWSGDTSSHWPSLKVSI